MKKFHAPLFITLCTFLFMCSLCPDKPSNHAPVIHSVSASAHTVPPGGYTTLTCNATDEDNQILMFSWECDAGGFVPAFQVPTYVSYDNFVIWVAPDIIGIHTIYSRVSDSDEQDQMTIDIDVQMVIPGCMDSDAVNYDENATEDDGSCIYTGTVSDIDGNSYDTVMIGEQEWFMENLRVSHYLNGDAISAVQEDALWQTLTSGGYSLHSNDPGNADTYGYLYNWYAVNDERSICPEEWHIATNDDWLELVDYLGGYQAAGGHLKATGTIQNGFGLWLDPNLGATNESGFTAIPGGSRASNGLYNGTIGETAVFWTSSEFDATIAYFWLLRYNFPQANDGVDDKRAGLSVRCIKDN